ncbi:MAG: DNA integrity scanning diadenylate cyclase DisA [Firmicutes bacterium]|jgi:diadenylate cyclase|nr:DNA integrity scanning diadenylate cyclase DisA [Bacillota bacterium]
MISDRLKKTLQMVAPGTQLHEGLENILRARTGGLIVVGDTPEVLALVNGGFRLDSDFSPFALYELAKMDGAIILSSDGEKILYANAHLNPDQTIPSRETGMRHSTAERVAKMTGQLVIAISQRRSVITLYSGHTRYVMQDIGVVLAKANQALQTLANYRDSLQRALTGLTSLEFVEEVTLADVARVLQRYELMRRVSEEVGGYIIELGTEGRLVQMQAEELLAGMADEVFFVVLDYSADGSQAESRKVLESLAEWDFDDVLDLAAIARALSRGSGASLEHPVSPRGYRALSKISRLPMSVIQNVVAGFGSLKAIRGASVEELDEVEGIGEVRARAVSEGLERLRDQAMTSATP